MSKPDEDCKDCAVEKIFGQGICKPQFEEFDRCFDDAMGKGKDADAICMPLFEALRDCMAKRGAVTGVMQNVMAQHTGRVS